MAKCPFATLKLLPENSTQARITPRAIIAHSAGGQAELYQWWMSDQSKGLESHFWISQDTGEIFQYIDTEVRADANGEANFFAISIETQSTTHANEGWSQKGLASLIRLMDWLCATHNIPRRLMNHPTDSGLAWHIMFGAPGPWTKAKGKVCPGPERIKQFKTIVVPTLAKGSVPTPPQKDELIMDAEVKARFDKLEKAINDIRAAVLIDIASGKDDATENGSLAGVVKSARAWSKADATYNKSPEEVKEITNLAKIYNK